MPISYVAKRFGMFFLVVWVAGTINFFIPRLGGQNPARAAMLRQAALGGGVQAGLDEMVAEYDKKFGLDKPLWKQYFTYIDDMSHFDFNYSISNYPTTVLDMIGEALPWTLGLLFDHDHPLLDHRVVSSAPSWPGRAPRDSSNS